MTNRIILLVLTAVSFSLAQNTIKAGQPATPWQYPDSDGKTFTMESWAGKVLMINYVDPDEAEMNEPFNDMVKHAIDVEKKLSRDYYKGFGIVDTKATWKPDALIRMIAGKKSKKFNTTVLFDYNADLRTKWGLKKDSYNVVIIDKKRVVRAVYTDKMTDAQMKEGLELLIKLTAE